MFKFCILKDLTISLQSFHLKIRGDVCPYFDYINFLPSTVRCLKLDPLNEDEAVKLFCGSRPSSSTTFIKVSFLQTLQNLSLVLDVISDKLVLSITKVLPYLLELHLKDRPEKEPTPSVDLTNVGLQSLGSCCHLKTLFLTRSRRNCQTSFKRVSDIGMFLLSEACRNLESVGLSGFSKVSDAGFASILHSSPKLKKFEVRNAALLSDLTFHGFSNAPSPLEEVKLVSCNNITSETVMNLSFKKSLELLNLGGCWSVADMGVKSITSLNKLICLDLAGADITDTALSALSQGSSPIKTLSLRGCKRVTDKGILTLFHGGGTAAKTLSILDLGQMPGITDVAIEAVAFAGNAITELCIRACFYVTDSSMRTLAKKGQLGDGKNLPLRKLDLFDCIGLSSASVALFKKPTFRGLWWLGVGGNLLDERGIGAFLDVSMDRPWLAVCTVGCEMGYDG